MSSIQFLPSLGMTGLYKLKVPYNALILATTQYTCTGVKSLAGAIAANEDPFTTIYSANGATQADFDADLASGAYIITITSGAGDIVEFPSTALVSVPDTDGVIYRNIVMSISLSALSDETDTTVLEQQVSDLVLNSIGVKSSIYLTQVGAVTVLSRAQSDAIESARLANIATPASALYQNDILTAENAALIQKVHELETFIAQRFADISI